MKKSVDEILEIGYTSSCREGNAKAKLIDIKLNICFK